MGSELKNLKEKEPAGLHIATKSDKNGMKGMLSSVDPKSEQECLKTLRFPETHSLCLNTNMSEWLKRACRSRGTTEEARNKATATLRA
jgi:hypothetical protein